MTETLSRPPEAIAKALHIQPDLPLTRKEMADTQEIRLTPLSPEDQQLAYLPDDIADEIFARLAEKNISAL